MDAYSFAHLSDPHLPLAPERPLARALLSKRLPSYLSWRRKRCRVHLPRVLDMLLADIDAHAPDHRVVTGDIANIALPVEFTAGLDFLRRVGPPDRVTFIPGNHDTLVPLAWDDGLGLWQDWMQGDGPAAGPAGQGMFPAVRVRGNVAFVGLNSGLPTPLGRATGTLGPDQLAAVETMLDDLGARGLFRVVLVHHPVADGVVRGRKALTDRAALRAVLKRSGAEMLLHGHAHFAHMCSLPGPLGPIPSLTVPSASAVRHGSHDAARWSLVRVSREGPDWRAEVTLRGLSDDESSFAEVGRFDYLLPGPDRT